MILTEEEIILILEFIAKQIPSGFGYSDDPALAKLQAKLSMMLEVKRRARLSKLRQ